VQSHVCEIYITNFIKVKNHFNHFWSIFSFFNTQLQVYFWYKYISIHHDIHSKQFFSFLFYCLGLCFTIICKNILKFLFSVDMVQVQKPHLRKQYNVTRQKHSLLLPSNAIFDERGWNEIKSLLRYFHKELIYK
jgi:hypothetical protein